MGMDERLHHLFARMPDAKVHLYGKEERPGRKIGHVNIVGGAIARREVRGELGNGPSGRHTGCRTRSGPTDGTHMADDEAAGRPRVGLIMGSDSDWPVMEAAASAGRVRRAVRGRRRVRASHAGRMLDYARPPPTAASR